MSNTNNHSAILQSTIEATLSRHQNDRDGHVADYIPELSNANPDHFGIALVTATGAIYCAGDAEVPFTIQSISKPFALGIALETLGPQQTYEHVGVEPTGEAFNALILDEQANRPFNPMVNAGAIAIASLVHDTHGDESFEVIRSTFSGLAGRELDMDEAVYRSEKETGHRNRALAYLMRGPQIISDPVEEKLDLYFRQCSIRVTAKDLATMAATLANVGANPVTGDQIFSPLPVRHVLSVMFTCGMYDYAGRWGVDVGLPAKSGVGGGVMAVVNRQVGIGLFSPLLDKQGNSVRGIKACIDLAEEFGLHAFEFTNAGSRMLDAYL
jgi:glutaminase